jgi:hypothetical protein
MVDQVPKSFPLLFGGEHLIVYAFLPENYTPGTICCYLLFVICYWLLSLFSLFSLLQLLL